MARRGLPSLGLIASQVLTAPINPSNALLMACAMQGQACASAFLGLRAWLAKTVRRSCVGAALPGLIRAPGHRVVLCPLYSGLSK